MIFVAYGVFGGLGARQSKRDLATEPHFTSLHNLARRREIATHDLVLKWLLAKYPGVVLALSGARRVEHAPDAARLEKFELSKADFQLIDSMKQPKIK